MVPSVQTRFVLVAAFSNQRIRHSRCLKLFSTCFVPSCGHRNGSGTRPSYCLALLLQRVLQLRIGCLATCCDRLVKSYLWPNFKGTIGAQTFRAVWSAPQLCDCNWVCVCGFPPASGKKLLLNDSCKESWKIRSSQMMPGLTTVTPDSIILIKIMTTYYIYIYSIWMWDTEKPHNDFCIELIFQTREQRRIKSIGREKRRKIKIPCPTLQVPNKP